MSKSVFILHKKVQLRNPVLIAAWPGLGQVAIRAAEHLRHQLNAELFAELKPGDFFYQSEVRVDKGHIVLPDLPSGKFFFWRNPSRARDILIFTCELQPPAEKSAAYAKTILNFAASLGVKTVVTFAAIVTTVDYASAPQVWMASTAIKTSLLLGRLKVKAMDACHISGMNGLFLGMAKQYAGMEGICFLSEVPFYASQIENPRASIAILQVVEKYFGIKKLKYTELTIAEKIFEEEVNKLLNFIRKPFEMEDETNPISNDDIEQLRNTLDAKSAIPNSAKETIERLFHEAKGDPRRALELKRKLDEWQIYSEYEDRFLQLFKDDPEPKP